MASTGEVDRGAEGDVETPRTAVPVDGSLVYYLRRDGLIKIGYTAKFASRMRSLQPEELLAVEPGSLKVETERHHKFAAHRAVKGASREWYHPNPDLLEHIARLAGLYILPLLPSEREHVDGPNPLYDQIVAALPHMTADELIGLGKLLIDPRAWRRNAMVELRRRGASLEDLAEQFGVNPATAFRWTKEPTKQRPGERAS